MTLTFYSACCNGKGNVREKLPCFPPVKTCPTLRPKHLPTGLTHRPADLQITKNYLQDKESIG